MSDNNITPPSAWRPLKRPFFRMLWISNSFSQIGGWMHEVGAAWLMTTLAPSPFMVAMIQTAAALPLALLALPAGALADIFNKKRLSTCNPYMEDCRNRRIGFNYYSRLY